MTRIHANLILLVTAMLWGSTFIVQHTSMENIGPFYYTGLRFLLGALFVLPFAWKEWTKVRAKNQVIFAKGHLSLMVLIGLAIFAGIILQQIGIKYTTVTNAGFLTAIYMPLVPIVGYLLFRQAPQIMAIPSALISLFGVYLLTGANGLSFQVGDLWVLSCTIFWAFHVLLIGRYMETGGHAAILATGQFFICAILSLVFGFFLEDFSWSAVDATKWEIVYGGVISVGVAFYLQVIAQRYSPAADTAIIISSETLFATVFAAILLGERLAPNQMAGCAMIFISIMLVQLYPIFKRKIAL